jgi:hypothetical protein
VLALIDQRFRARRREAELLSALEHYRHRGHEAMLEHLQDDRPTELFRADGTRLKDGATLEEVLAAVKRQSRDTYMPKGFPIYVDPLGLEEAGVNMATKVKKIPKDAPLAQILSGALAQLGLGYSARDGLITITSEGSVDANAREEPYQIYRRVLR